MSILNTIRRSYNLDGVTGLLKHSKKDTVLKFVDHKTNHLCRSIGGDIFGTYWISIQHILNDSTKVYIDVTGPEAPTGVCSGRWDKYAYSIEEHPLYEAMSDRFVENVPWDQTAYYEYCVKKIRYDGRAWNGCTTVSELQSRCKRVDYLFKDIENRGLLPWFERPDETKVVQVGKTKIPDELIIGIGRTGTPIRLDGGRHRLMIGLILGFERIPAVVTLCHSQYNEKNNIIESDAVLDQIASVERTKQN